MIKNKNVVERFIDKEIAQGSNLISSGNKLFSYRTCIAQWVGNTMIINLTKYSSTTSRHQTYLRAIVEYELNRGVIEKIIPKIDVEINTRELDGYGKSPSTLYMA